MEYLATFPMGTNLIPYTSNVPNEPNMLIRGSKCKSEKSSLKTLEFG